MRMMIIMNPVFFEYRYKGYPAIKKMLISFAFSKPTGTKYFPICSKIKNARLAFKSKNKEKL